MVFSSFQLPVVVGFGGVNSAGRTSFYHGFRWMVYEALKKEEQEKTLQALNCLASAEQPQQSADYWKKHSFIRQFVSANPLVYHQAARLLQDAEVSQNVGRFDSASSTAVHENATKLAAGEKIFYQTEKKMAINMAAQLPTDFDPGTFYPANHHPRGLKMAVYGVNDALAMIGLDYTKLSGKLRVDQIGVYASSMLGQLDEFGIGGYMKARAQGKRATSKQFPLSMPQMVADFLNAYVLGNYGYTFAAVGACATFLYNLAAAVHDIQTGVRHLAVVGASDAPLLPEVIDAYAAMGALMTDENLRKLDGLAAGQALNFSKACRPFGNNLGFVLGESSQFVVLTSAELALEVGANIYGAVGGVFIHADGHKKSISKPGLGNYISFLRAANLTEAIVGAKEMRCNTFLSAHGTGTPQNRVTESRIFSEVAALLKVENWPVCAVKNYLGHSTAPASGDQLNAALGSLQHDLLPGITAVEKIADDVCQKNLHFCLQHQPFEKNHFSAAIINAKGFGGNNASGVVLSAHKVLSFLEQRYGQKTMQQYARKQALAEKTAVENDQKILQHTYPIRYLAKDAIDENVGIVDEENHFLMNQSIKIPKIFTNPYANDVSGSMDEGS